MIPVVFRHHLASAQRVSRYSPDGTDAPSGGAPSPKRSWDGRMLL